MRHVTAVAIAVLSCGVMASQAHGADERQDGRVQQGKARYDAYCRPCHGPGGGPGSAVSAATGRPIDLRTYERRNGGTFPSWKWWDVTFSPQPGAAHTQVWERIRTDQSEPGDRDTMARGVVATIEIYVRSIQVKK